MRIGQTSIVVFSSKFLGSILAFLASLYFARTLGAEAFGVYGLVLTIVTWLKLGGTMGVGSAMTKRISEDDEPGAFLSAGLLSVLVFGFVASALVVLGGDLVTAYIGAFDRYVAASVVWVILVLLFIKLFYTVVIKTLEGERKVHVAALLDPIKFGSRSVIQIGLVFAGFGLGGMLLGYAIGGVLIGVIGSAYVSIPLTRPAKRHFQSLYEYARYSWLGSLKSRSFNDVDILVLGVFVGEALIGIYFAAWSIAKFLNLFATAIQSTLFPEISHLAERRGLEAVTGLIEDSLTFAGLLVIPGLAGGVILGDRLLAVYGPEFVEGTTVFGLLLLAVLLYGYQKQLLNALNAVDRPDIAFRINAAFIALNASLNVALIWRYGLVGAAIATAASAALGLTVSYVALGRLLRFEAPTDEIARQAFAALVMGVVIHVARTAGEGTPVAAVNEAFVLLLVAAGAAIYFLVLVAISSTFRGTVRRNAPFDLPNR
ncbi:oligosaccharide flippase family protein [Halorubrum sp. JWXQ-INN 858]|uniref:oligosaccharide flippase family protein n=1 Tax=Halorubrum sp. JWXQ-INN 858 TaxID=2690782 RepID=UPI001357D519|nr:oligosaccharide flippase family protein [Halorubrum sp. JWXQ-INN 858]MWV64984.1 oligosaccharide flippase family protein [Halorubrum sp. JWXQ-INN 858]